VQIKTSATSPTAVGECLYRPGGTGARWRAGRNRSFGDPSTAYESGSRPPAPREVIRAAGVRWLCAFQRWRFLGSLSAVARFTSPKDPGSRSPLNQRPCSLRRAGRRARARPPEVGERRPAKANQRRPKRRHGPLRRYPRLQCGLVQDPSSLRDLSRAEGCASKTRSPSRTAPSWRKLTSASPRRASARARARSSAAAWTGRVSRRSPPRLNPGLFAGRIGDLALTRRPPECC